MNSLHNAIRAAIAHENSFQDLKLEHWANTFGCSTEDIKTAWEQIIAETVA